MFFHPHNAKYFNLLQFINQINSLIIRNISSDLLFSFKILSNLIIEKTYLILISSSVSTSFDCFVIRSKNAVNLN